MAFKEIFSWGMTGSLEQARQLHLARLVNQSQRTIWFIFPAHGASHIINDIFIIRA